MAIQASFAEELSGFQDSDHGFLALLGHNANLYLSLLDIENSIRGVALRKDDLVLVKFQYGCALGDLGEKEFWIKQVFRGFRHEPLVPGSCLSLADAPPSMLGKLAVLRLRLVPRRSRRLLDGTRQLRLYLIRNEPA
jgi:hypothetical protein